MRNALATACAADAAEIRSAGQTAELLIEELYDEHARSLFRYAYAITRSAEDAEDVLQEVFSKIARDPRRLTSIRAAKPYLFSAVRNASYSILRSRNHRSETLNGWADAECVPCSDAAAGIIESQVMREAFATLPTDQREVLALKVYDQMSFREIAEVVGVSINTIASRYRYGIDKLREALEVDDDGR